MNGLITIALICLATFQPSWWNNTSTPGWGANRSTTGGLWIPQGPESVDQFEALATLPLLHTPDRIEVVLRTEWESTIERDVWPDRAELRATHSLPSLFTLIGVEDLPSGSIAWWRAETSIGVTGDQEWWWWTFEAGESIRYDVQVQRRSVPEPGMFLLVAVVGLLMCMRLSPNRPSRVDCDDWRLSLQRDREQEAETSRTPWWSWVLMVAVAALVLFGFAAAPIAASWLIGG